MMRGIALVLVFLKILELNGRKTLRFVAMIPNWVCLYPVHPVHPVQKIWNPILSYNTGKFRQDEQDEQDEMRGVA